MDARDFLGTTHGTRDSLKCDICGRTYNEDGYDPNGEWVSYIEFMEKTIAECCFNEFVREIIRNMPSYIESYRTILKQRKERLESDNQIISDIDLLMERNDING